MPFGPIPANRHPDWCPQDGSNEPEIILRQVSPTRFQLLEGFRYQALGGGEQFQVPAHDPRADPASANNSTDLTSVPQLLWWFVASYGTHTRAALFHDHFVDTPDENGQPPSRVRRGQIDRAFEQALGESELRWLRRKLVWTAVSLRTSWGRWGLALIVGHLLALAGLVVWSLAFGGPAWSALAVSALGFLWGLLRPPYGGLSGLGWGAARWPLAVLGSVFVGLPCVIGLVVLKLAQFADLVEEVVAAGGRTISRNTRWEPADTGREFKWPPSAPEEVGRF